MTLESGTDESTPENSSAGQLDLVGLFQAEAISLAATVARGRLLHKTKNIRDSGAPFETELRELFKSRLPFQFQVEQGYLFDVMSNCSPQIDAIISKSADSHILMKSSEGAAYMPFPSALAIMEIKNGAASFSKNLDQIIKIITSVDEMKRSLHQLRPSGGPIIPNLVSVMFFGDSTDLSITQVKSWFKNNFAHPTYTVFLDRGIIIAMRHPLYSSIEFGSENGLIDLYEHRQGRVPFFCTPFEKDNIQGRALLWIYFSIIAHAHLSDGNNGHISDFALASASSYNRLRAILPVDQANDWDDISDAHIGRP